MVGIKSQHPVNSVFFVEDGKQVFSGGKEGMLRRWRVGDGHEVGEPISVGGQEIYAAVLSPDRKWLVCGLRVIQPGDGIERVRIWDAQTHEKVLDIKGHTNTVLSVDISPDSTKIATGGFDKLAFIWSMPTGERLVGPLQHDGTLVAVRFSPNGDRIAVQTATNSDATGSIRIYNSENGQQLLEILLQTPPMLSSPFVWSVDGRQLFALSAGEAKSFDTSSGILLSKWSIHSQEAPTFVALAHNQKFIVTSANKSLSFWDTSTHTQIGTVVEHASTHWSIALSPNDDCIATGEENGVVTLRSLHDILPISYFTVNVSDFT
jgi:WD40 repeat protein